MTSIQRVRLLASALAIGLVVLTGCNTIEGIGKDIKKAGETIEEVAQ
ncbi:entericidin A/B family lipoprotein [Desulfohalobium retbaense]|uniref:Entericidin EcnAB n=1 Tax=Desulfohalobium retbaense (strain ATCC 49708 / DSM 5692 / JCM 16813 / HR100) TaxID=485915 RepID=C8X1X0_DESRD|nr:entericidin A/B family lipoprotein [Desulfohalobium retbaense]ACV68542.1 Entericidin EcnAB [Desulfohalobium retbaense DSM 5692]